MATPRLVLERWFLVGVFVIPFVCLFAPGGLTIIGAALGFASLIAGAWRCARYHRGMLLLVCAFLLWAGLTTLWSIAPADSFSRWTKVVAVLVALAAALLAVNELGSSARANLQTTLAISWAAALVLMAIDTLVLHGDILHLVRPPYAESVWTFVPYKRSAAMLTLLAPAVLSILVGRGRLLLAATQLGLLCLVLWTISATTALLTLIAGISTFGLCAVVPKSWLRGVPAVVAAIMFLTPAVIMVVPRDMSPLASSVSTSALHRAAIWRFAVDRIAERPLFGWGMDSSRAIPGGKSPAPLVHWLRAGHPTDAQPDDLIRYLEDTQPELMPLHPHNVALQWWMELGGIGAVLAALVTWRLGFGVVSTNADRCRPAAGAATLVIAMTLAAASYGAWQSWWLSALGITAICAVFTWSENEPRVQV